MKDVQILRATWDRWVELPTFPRAELEALGYDPEDIRDIWEKWKALVYLHRGERRTDELP